MNLKQIIFAAASLTTLSAVLPADAAESTATLDTKVPCENPAYPRASLANEEKGTVVLAMLVSVEGAVTDSKIEKSSGFKNLDRAAQKALSACKFKPIMKDGKAEQGWAKIDYVWKLE